MVAPVPLPRVTDDLPGTGGTIKESPEDFLVEEVPAYAPSGKGEHCFVFFEKVDLTTAEAVRRIASALHVYPGEAGVAGQKDRHARTRQWISLQGVAPERALGLHVEGVQVLEAALHENKLRTGHLRGNRFEIRIRGVAADAGDRAAPILERLEAAGVPGYFGPQRFGRDGRGAEFAREWLAGRAKPPRDRGARKLGASAWQSAIFNEVCARRVRLGWLRALSGDLCRKEDTGGLFHDVDVVALQQRMDRAEISPTGPMPGAKMREPVADALLFEQEGIGSADDVHDIVRRWAAILPGTRRPLRHFPKEVSVRVEADSLLLSFTLPSGAYATVLLDEVTKNG